MCDNPNIVWLVRDPKPFYGNFIVKTRQYNEYAQYDKEYILFKNKKNWQIAKKFNHIQDVALPCGKCVQCVHSRSRNWSLRSTLELSKYSQSCCLTLTYNDDNLPEKGLLNYKDFQLFVKKLRNHLAKYCRECGIDCPKIKYFVCGEYGRTSTMRPHFHCIIMGYFPHDIDIRFPYKITRKRTKLFKSDFINSLWSKGFVDVGLCNHQTCRYISQYCCKKFLNTNSDYVKKCEEKKEFLHASTGFGLEWFINNYRSVIDSGKIQLGGYIFGIPRYFIKKLEFINKSYYDKWKKKSHDFFVNYKFTEDIKNKSRALSDKILGRLKNFSNKNVDDLFLEPFLHNIHYVYQSYL